jgi:hypothetical protein
MKKIAIGCGIAALVALVAGAAVTYVVVNKVRSTVADFAVLSEVPQIERGLRHTAAFTPPPSGELTGAQVERLVQVQQQIRSIVGTRFAEFEAKYKDLSERMNRNEGSVFDAPAVVSAYRDLAQTYVEAKRAQVAALNDATLSLEEYRWIRTQAYAAMGVAVSEFDIARVIEDVTEGREPRQPDGTIVAGPAGPETNKTLVEPHRKALEDNVAMMFFGL